MIWCLMLNGAVKFKEGTLSEQGSWVSHGMCKLEASVDYNLYVKRELVRSTVVSQQGTSRLPSGDYRR